MSNWRKEMEDALVDFVTVSQLAGDPINLDDLKIEFLDAPHKPPSALLVKKRLFLVSGGTVDG